MTALLHARVHGAGPTGALTALAFAQAGWQVSLHDPLGRDALLGRCRAYALTHSSRRLLRRLGLWTGLEPRLVPFCHLQLRDLGSGADAAFSSPDLGGDLVARSGGALGWIALHDPLMEALLQAVEAHPAVRLALGEPVASLPPSPRPNLVVAADGPASPTRQALGIGQWRWPYRQACLTVQVELRGSRADEAWELLRPEGPFAVLPLGGRRAQLVWSAPAGRCRQLEGLEGSAFLDRLAAALPDRLQPDALLDRPRAFPVSLELARRLQRGHTVLVGESAHRCHPVGGQGLNLCWRDVEVLHRLALRAAEGRLPPARLAAAYACRRWPDLLLTLLATDLLVRLFSNRQPLLLPVRRLALAALASSEPLRRLALGVMTHGPCRPLPAAAP
ncbi:MAG: FAD-dependent monooxygenase [Synechococcaceae cyanobacterium]|nr:FAD-dependent monooxygenase [Synechococcaceae cyanobacterium]